MFALVSLWQLPEASLDQPLPELEQRSVALVMHSPGVIEGFWTYERANGKSVGFTLLDTAEHARDLKNAIESHVEAQDHLGVQLEMIRVQEIVIRLAAESASGATV
jgi:hypothetical protein